MLVEISRSLYLQQLLITVVRMNTNWDTIKPVHPMLPVPHPDSSSSCSPNPLFVSIFTLRAFPRQQAKLDNIKGQIFSNFIAVRLCQCLILFIRPVSIVAKGFHLQFPGYILSCFKILESLSIATKDNFCLLVNRFQFNTMPVSAFMTNDWQVYHGFVYLVEFVQFLLGTSFLAVDLSN